MTNFQLPEPELLKTILEPLLEDFQYWLERSKNLFETERISFLTLEEQSHLLERVKHAKQEVSAAQMLFNATDGKVGIELASMKPWHQLIAECWQISMRWRTEQSRSL
jgi:hypothetical protein